MIPNEPSTSKQKSSPPSGNVNLLYLALLGGQMVIGAILYKLSVGSSHLTQEVELASGIPLHRLIAGFLLLFAVLTAIHIRGRLAQGPEPPDPKKTQKVALLAWVLVEGANLTTVVLAFQNQDRMLFLAFALGLLAFAWLRPATWPSLREC